MKKLFFFVLIAAMFTTGLKVSGQVFGYPGATWVFQNTPIHAVCFATYEKWVYTGDTIVAGDSCKKVEVTRKITPPNPMPANTYYFNEFFKVNGDTVWVYTGTNWQELYNFSLQSGDTTHSPLLNNFAFGYNCDSIQPYQFPAIVTATGLDTIAGISLRYYTVKYRIGAFNDDFSDTTYAYETYYERLIGPYWQPYDGYFCGAINECTPMYPVCYRDNDMLTDSLCSDLSWFEVLSVPEPEQMEFKLYPNPATHVLVVQTNLPNQNYYDILSVDGKLILANIQSPIDISHLPSGVYFITDHHRTGYHKFIKN